MSLSYHIYLKKIFKIEKKIKGAFKESLKKLLLGLVIERKQALCKQVQKSMAKHDVKKHAPQKWSEKMKKKCTAKITGLLLSAVLLLSGLTGCSKGTGEESLNTSGGTEVADADGKGRFIESEVAVPVTENDVILAMEKLEDKSVELLVYDTVQMTHTFYVSQDMGENWSRQDIAEETIAGNYICAADIGADGTAVLVGMSTDESGNRKWSLFTAAKEGSVQNLELVFPNGNAEQNIIRTCKISDNGNVLLQNYSDGNIYRVDMTTGACALFCETSVSYASYFGTAGEQILVVTRNGIELFNSTDGSSITEDSILNEMITGGSTGASRLEKVGEYTDPVVFTGGMNPDVIVYANHEGVFYHTRGGEISEQLINGSLNSLGDTSIGMGSIVMMDEENFLIYIQSAAEGYKLLRYTFDKQAPAMPEKELTVYALEDSTFLRQVAASYQRTHQDVYVNLEIGMSGSDGKTTEDALTALSADILAGTGPDVLILDGIPIDSYVEKGILADIHTIVDEIEKTDGIFSNIRDAYDDNGAVYTFPARFYVSLILGDAQTVAAGASLAQLADYAESLREENAKRIFPARTEENFLQELYMADSARWMKDDGSLDEAVLKEWLTQAGRLYAVDKEQENAAAEFSAVNSGSLVNTADSFGILLKENQIGVGALVSINCVQLLNAASQTMEGSYDLLNRDKVQSFIPYLQIGITSNTGLMEDAQEFVRTMLGKECNSIDGNGFPVNRAAYDVLCENAKTMYDENNQGGISVSTSEGEEVSVNIPNLTDAEVKSLTAMLEGLKQPICMDGVVIEIVIEQGVGYLKGEQSVDEALTAIMQKCNLYLSE